MEIDKVIPKKIFIIPYRNRVQQKFFFCKYMSFILEDKEDYEIYFSHQCDTRSFNRGAVKNIGFLAMKYKYPNDYKNITFIFNDVDTIPFNKIFDYETEIGIVKHYYGFKYALGGIVVIKGADFEKINGFPCYWGWGMEDSILQKRCQKFGITIDRSIFYTIGSPEILQLFDGVARLLSKKEVYLFETDNGVDGLTSIRNLSYTLDENSGNPSDNIFTVHNPNIMFINISYFLTHIPFVEEDYYMYDIREPRENILHPEKNRKPKQVVLTTNEWVNIPEIPHNKMESKHREEFVKQLITSGKQIPRELLNQIKKDKKNEVVKPPIPPNKYSRQYASYIGAPSRAQPSARVKLGGVF
jgi:hypothetical protein